MKLKMLTTPLALTISIFLISIFIVYYWISRYSWLKISTSKEMEYNGQQILNSPKIPQKIYNIYEKIEVNEVKTSMIHQVTSQILFPLLKRKNCKCDKIGYLAWNNKNLNFKFNLSQILKKHGYLKFGFGIEKYSSSKKCFDFWLNNSIYLNNHYLKSLNELSQIKIYKNIEELNDDEIIKLLAWFKALNYGRNNKEEMNKFYRNYKQVYRQ